MNKEFNQITSSSSSPSEEQQRNKINIKDLVSGLVDAWNNHDAKTFASYLTEDGEWTDVIGQTTIGRKKVERLHNYLVSTVLKEAVLIVKSQRIRWIKDNEIASVDIIWESIHNRTPEGNLILTVRHGLLNLIVVKKGKKDKERILVEGEEMWKIVIGHNVDYTSTYTQSDVQKIIK